MYCFLKINSIKIKLLELEIVVQNLSKVQLAEATIAGFDSAGKPNSGTILIDHDANGLSSNGDVGWFIDETPLDNSEFLEREFLIFVAINSMMWVC